MTAALYHMITRITHSFQDGSEDTSTLVKGNRNFSQMILWPPAVSLLSTCKKGHFRILWPILCFLDARHDCNFDDVYRFESHIRVKVSLAFLQLPRLIKLSFSFQMLRGSVIVFVAIFSMIFLQRRLQLREWTGIGFIIIGLTMVGLSDMIGADPNHTTDRTNILIGDSLIILAQIITASQMVFEERFVAGLDIPALQAVGWEGFFGFFVLSFLLVPFYFIGVPESFTKNPHKVVEDAIDAFYMIRNNTLLLVPISGKFKNLGKF